jgi:hypothetical protein
MAALRSFPIALTKTATSLTSSTKVKLNSPHHPEAMATTELEHQLEMAATITELELHLQLETVATTTGLEHQLELETVATTTELELQLELETVETTTAAAEMETVDMAVEMEQSQMAMATNPALIKIIKFNVCVLRNSNIFV